MTPKKKPGRLLRFFRSIAANSAVVTLLALLLATVGLGVTGVYLLVGLGWAFIAGSLGAFFLASFLRMGLIRK